MTEEQKKTQEYNLDEAAVKKLELENRDRALKVKQMKLQLEELETFLEKGTRTKLSQAKINKIKAYIESKTDDDGKVIPDADLEAMAVNVNTMEKALAQGLDEEGLRINISKLKMDIELQEKNHKVAEKQIRERKIIYTQ